MQQMADIVENDSKKISCLNWTIHKGTRKPCVSYQTDADNLNIAVYR